MGLSRSSSRHTDFSLFEQNKWLSVSLSQSQLVTCLAVQLVLGSVLDFFNHCAVNFFQSTKRQLELPTGHNDFMGSIYVYSLNNR